ncbi:MAG: Xaa-Pro aminopeptidase [Gemmatimonadota bacterium]
MRHLYRHALTVSGAALVLGTASARAQDTTAPAATSLPTWSRQIAERERWLLERHALILPLMRAHAAAMWIVVNEEFHDDPLTQLIAPPRPYAGNRDFFVFIDAGAAGLAKYSITGYPEENLGRFFEPMPDGRNPGKALSELIAKYHPATIALALDGTRGVTRGLSHATYEALKEWLGTESSSRFVSAADLIEDYLDTRIPEELATYTTMVRITDEITKRVLSNAVVKPGTTTVGDMRRWLFDELGRRGLGTWFQPDVRIQRVGGVQETGKHAATPNAPGPAREGEIVRAGDVVHLDFGISAMGLNTDWQKMAYVLKPGERDVPSGLKQAMANTNALQDAVMRTCSRPARPNTEVYDCAMAEMKRRGIEAMIYSHPIGNQGHGLGAGVAYGAAADRPAKPLRLGSYISIELNTATPVAEWNGQKVYVMMEDDAHLTETGWQFFVPRQERWYLIR